MELHYVGLCTLFLFLLFTAFVLGGLYLLYTAMRILNCGFHQKTGRNIFYPLYFVLCNCFSDPDDPLSSVGEYGITHIQQSRI